MTVGQFVSAATALLRVEIHCRKSVLFRAIHGIEVGASGGLRTFMSPTTKDSENSLGYLTMGELSDAG